MSQPSSPPPKGLSNLRILFFVLMLFFICGLILAVVAFSLQVPQEEAKKFDQSKQMLVAAKILNPAGYFEILDADGAIKPARFDPEQKILVPVKENEKPPLATEEEIKEIAERRIQPLLTDESGAVYALEEKDVELGEYLTTHKKTGYAQLPLKLVYAILSNESKEKIPPDEIVNNPRNVHAFVFPISGFGLWGPIYGYIAVAPDGDRVIGTTWYEHAETPGLGANITEPWWQRQFYGKEIFQLSADGKTDFKTANLGIIVVKGKVQDVYGNSPRSKSAVDGMSGATLTGDGVTQAYRNSLNPYRAFLIKVHYKKKENGDGRKTTPS